MQEVSFPGKSFISIKFSSISKLRELKLLINCFSFCLCNTLIYNIHQKLFSFPKLIIKLNSI